MNALIIILLDVVVQKTVPEAKDILASMGVMNESHTRREVHHLVMHEAFLEHLYRHSRSCRRVRWDRLRYAALRQRLRGQRCFLFQSSPQGRYEAPTELRRL